MERPNFHIVGLSASAGGLEPLEEFFDAMPPDTGMAFVVVQHLSPDFKSHMEEMLRGTRGWRFTVSNMKCESNQTRSI
ncbi:MAG: chemotaxis protein CheB [Pirellulaceae bacterium]